jgi:hypothetical protein
MWTPEILPAPEEAPELINPPGVDGPVTFDSVPLDDTPLSGELLTEDALVAMEPFAPFGYRVRRSQTSWLPGGGDQFGMFSIESLPSLAQEETWGLVTGMGFHFLSGPVRTDMPPRLFDFQIGGQARNSLTEELRYDVRFVVGAFSDFEGSVFGVDYLDRDDVRILPVAGLILTPRDDLRLELVFPTPRIDWRISPTSSLYLAGEFGGGTWAIERVPDADDVATYRDLKLLFGISTRDSDGSVGGLEIGYVFGRELSYRSGVGDYSLGDAILIRSTTRY